MTFYAKLEAIQQVLRDQSLKLQSNNEIRRLSLNNAVQAIYQTCLSAVLEESQNNKNATALGLHTFLTIFELCAFLCLPVDVLNV
jgi:hypothetical protein